MAIPGESRYGNELLSWAGFGAAEEIGKELKENLALSRTLEEKSPGLAGRVSHVLDLVGFLKEVPPHTLPVQALATPASHMQALLQQLHNVESNVAYVQQVESQTAAALSTLIPLLGVMGDKDYTEVVESVREEARTVIHGLRTSAGRLESDLERIAGELKSEHEGQKTSLHQEWDQTNQTLVEEAASMRARTETSVTEARTNAETHFQAMRTEVDAIRERADTAYKEAMASFEKDKSTIEASRLKLQESFEEQVSTWSQAVVSARESIDAEIDAGRARLEDVVDWADSIRGDIQIAALAAGFDEARRRYRSRAMIALGVAVALTIFTVTLTVVLFSRLWDVPPDATNSELVRQVGLRLGAIALPLAAGVFSARVYRTNSHLEAVNSERAQASKAFEGFASRATADESKDAMLVILAQLVFAGRDTGHHTDERILPLDISALTKQITGRR